ncbi:FAD/NAD(P)-binding protein [Nocardioides montaniterrae]
MSEEQLAAQKIPVTQVKVVSIGGGLGSFALVDRLRIGGVPAGDIAVVSAHRQPVGAFLERSTSSGLFLDDRLRSDSRARIDNPWGFPGYAAGEAWSSRSVKPLLGAIGRPLAKQPYTPTVRRMNSAVTREGHRIGWSRMTVVAQAEYLFKRAGGGYFVICRKDGRLAALQCDHVHLALGAPGPTITPEADEFRTGDEDGRVRHVYEEHEDVIESLAASGGSVVVRGAGTSAANLLRRIGAAREVNGADIHVWHLMRRWPVADDIRPEDSVGLGFVRQDLDFPRSAYGGELGDRIRATEDEDERIRLIEQLGATTSPFHGETERVLASGRHEGWYDAVVGQVESFMPRGAKVVASVRLENGEEMALAADHVLDATGLERRADHHGLVADLLRFNDVSLNRLGGLRVDEVFGVTGGTSGEGRMFASGATARGGHYGPVDSFAGMQYAALTIADQLAAAGIGRRLGPLRSLRGWLGWMGGREL